jgi:DNA segregation ATPase FtsK/SpoIIIE-like protein
MPKKKPTSGAARPIVESPVRKDRWRRRAQIAAGATMLASALIAWWQPPALQRLMTPVWTAMGPAMVLLPLWATAFYLTSRRYGKGAFRRWRLWLAGLLGLAALIAIPNALGGLSIGWLPLQSAAGAFLTGSLLGAVGVQVWLGTAGLAASAAVLAFPHAAWTGATRGLEGLSLGAAAAAKGSWLSLQWAGRKLRQVRLPAFRRPARQDDDDDYLDDGFGALTGALETSPSRDTIVLGGGQGRPRIILPAQAQVDNEDDFRNGLDDQNEEEDDAEFDDEEGGYDEDLELEEEDDEEQPAEKSLPAAASKRPAPSLEKLTRPRTDEELLASRDPIASVPNIKWQFPPLDIFAPEPALEIDHEAHLQTAEAIESTLAEYGIEAQVTEVRPGPTVTLYGLRPGWTRRFKEVKEKDADGTPVTRREEVGRVRVKVDRIAALDRDLALQLKAPSIRIEAPIPGTNLIGLEVPNAEPQTVYIRSQLQSEAFRRMRARTKLAVPLGKGSGGEAQVADLSKMPHLLVAGATGSGKSVFVNSLITSLLWHVTPQDVRFIMVDPKRVELTIYNGIPHLLTPVIVDTNKAVNALRWAIMQMETRLRVLAEAGVRDIGSYNRKHEEADRMPYMVVIVDELADLMITSGKAVEQGLVRLAQMGRATGIHLVVATQRPSVDVITGLIKANFPTRISFMVTSLVDSRTILDGAGAEKLLGRGDMLYLPQDASRPYRIQSAFVSEEEATQVTAFWKAQSGGYAPPELPDLIGPEDLAPSKGARNGPVTTSYMPRERRSNGGSSDSGADGGGGEGDIVEQARELADLYQGKVSTSLLQRRLGIGYPRAARLRDQLVREGLALAEIPNAPAETKGKGRRRMREEAEE